MAKGEIERLQVVYSGNVQGVGFRYTARSIARGFAVAGYVRNLSDGRVEVVVEGQPAELRAFLGSLGAEMRQYIFDTQEMQSPPTGKFESFDIRY